jgi:hypothetical protein
MPHPTVPSQSVPLLLLRSYRTPPNPALPNPYRANLGKPHQTIATPMKSCDALPRRDVPNHTLLHLGLPLLLLV